MTDRDSPTLESRAQRFAVEVQETVNAVLPGKREIVSRRVEGADRYIVQPVARSRIPLFVNDEHLADLSISIWLSIDHTGAYLKAVRSDFGVHSTLDRTPLLRLEYRSDMRSAPIAHWQIHAERGAFSHLLARAHQHRPDLVSKPHDLSSLHLPVGGERFRPCLEDVLHFLVHDCGLDHRGGWESAVNEGRERWRRRQLGSVVRDSPSEAARVLRELGWHCAEPDNPLPENRAALTTW